jgi:hypothetical protein
MANNDIKIRFGSDVSGFKKGANQVKSKLKSLAGSAASIFGVGLGGAALVAGTKKIIDYGDQLGKTAKRIGISAEEYQKLAFAARRSGATTETVERGFKRMQSTIFDAERGLAGSVDTLTALGLTIDDLKRKSPEQQFTILADALNKVKDATTRAALAQDVFGRAGTDIMPMLNDYKQLSQEIEDMGGIISNDAIKAAEDFKDSLENIGTTIQAALMNSGIINWLANIIDKMDAFNKLKASMSEANKKGIVTKEQAVERIKTQIKSQLKSDPEFKKAFVKRAEEIKKSMGFFKKLAYNPVRMAFDEERQKRLADMGFTNGATVVTKAITKKEVVTAKDARENAPIASAMNEYRKNLADSYKKDTKNAAKEAERAAKAEEKRQAKQAEFLADMKHKLEMQKLINAGKEKEARIEEELYNLKKRGIQITPEIRAQVEQLDALKNKSDKSDASAMSDRPAAVASIPTDRLARIGGIVGNTNRVINQIDVRRNQLLETIAKNTTPDITNDNEDYSKWA